MPDLTGLSREEAEKKLEEAGLSMLTVGTEQTVTGQLPAPGKTVRGGSGLVVYFGDTPEEEMVKTPDFTGMTVAEANAAAGNAGLCVQTSGNPDLTLPLRVMNQYPAPGTELETGSIVELKFTDPTVRN